MSSDWKRTTIEQVASKVDYGYTASASSEKVGPKFLRITDIQNGVVDWGSVPFCEIDSSSKKKYQLERGDIVVARTGNSTGENFIYQGGPETVFASYLIRFRLDPSIVEPSYVWRCMRSRSWWNFVEGSKTGSAQAGANAKVLGRFEFVYPPINEQKAIARILGTLDDKIELNRKTNETLEGIAKALFKSWFVDFDPVKAKAEGRPTGLPDEVSELFPDSFEESELGEIPSGWSPSSVGEISKNLDRLRVPLSKKQRSQKQGSFPYYGATGVFDYVDDFLFDGDYLLIGEDGSVAKEDGTAFSQYVSGKIWVNNHAHVLEGILPVTTEFLYCFFQFAQVTPYVTGAVQLKLSQGRMNMIQLPLADEKLLCLFGEMVRPVFSRIQSIQKEILSLGELRDALLPCLISGELRVPDAEKMLEEVGI